MTATCENCRHACAHNFWGKCLVNGCTCRDYVGDIGLLSDPEVPEPPPATTEAPTGGSTTQVYRNPETGRPIAVPDEIIREEERPYRAYLRFRAGSTWEQIAQEEHWPDAAAVQATVKRYLDEGRAVVGEFTRNEMKAIQLDRLHGLVGALYPKALDGNLSAAAEVHKVIKTIMQSTGSDKDEGTDELNPTTIVVASSEMLAKLQGYAELAESSRKSG